MPVVTATPTEIVSLSTCYCFPPVTQGSIIIYLLAQAANNTMTPTQLADAAKCFCFDPVTMQKAIVYLLAQIAITGVGGSGLVRVTGTAPNLGLDARLATTDPWTPIIAPGP